MTIALPPDPMVPIEALTTPREKFRCVPLAAVLSAGSCLLKQQQARTDKSAPWQPRAMAPPCRDCADGRRVQERMDASTQESRVVEAVTPANTNDRVGCEWPDCDSLPASIRKNTPAEFTGYCLVHRKKKMDQKRWSKDGRTAAKEPSREASQRNPSANLKGSPIPKPVLQVPTPAPLSLANPSVLADLLGLCVNAGRNDLAVTIGIALAASVRERKAGG